MIRPWDDALADWWVTEVATDPVYAEEVIPLALGALDPQPGCLYLELGCGEGAVMRAVAARRARVLGCDLSERLATAEEDLPEGVIGPRIEPYVPEEFREQRRPFLRYTLTGPYTLEALRLHVDERLAPGVLQPEGGGGGEARRRERVRRSMGVGTR